VALHQRHPGHRPRRRPPQLEDTVDLDAQAAKLGITVGGNSYSMDIFHAERHTDKSNFRIDTSIECFIIPG
jgi:fibro-slime domain-containing protein